MKEKRFFLDVRIGCAAIRDRLHPKYDPDYNGLNPDVHDVVEYVNGSGPINEYGYREISSKDIEYLATYLNTLNQPECNLGGVIL